MVWTLIFGVCTSWAGGLPVVGGEPAVAGSWPDAAAVLSGQNLVCSGVLIAPSVVLTAGHCAANITTIVVDATNLVDGGEAIGVETVIPHDSWQTTYDVSLVILQQEAKTPPRMIAQDCIIEDALHDGASVAIVGYGATDEWASQFWEELYEAYTVVTDADCSELDLGCNAAVSPGGELGAGGDGIDSCSGDSGGPLYLMTESGAYLVGLTSRAYDRAVRPCGEGGIYVRPDAIIDWIEAEAEIELPRPDCGQGSGDSGQARDSGTLLDVPLAVWLDPIDDPGRNGVAWPGGCGCAAGGLAGGSGLGWVLALVLLRRRGTADPHRSQPGSSDCWTPVTLPRALMCRITSESRGSSS